MLYELDGVRPTLGPEAWVAPDAAVIGDVVLGARATVWFGCLLRGDTNRIRIGARTNIQDLSVLHVNPGAEWDCIVGDDVTVGHAAIVHACKLHDGAFVGMGATVLDGAVIESGGMLAAGGLLAPGKRIPGGRAVGRVARAQAAGHRCGGAGAAGRHRGALRGGGATLSRRFEAGRVGLRGRPGPSPRHGSPPHRSSRIRPSAGPGRLRAGAALRARYGPAARRGAGLVR